MPYDPEIEHVIDGLFGKVKNMSSKKMFGGVCYLYKGNMAFGIYKSSMIVRLGSQEEADKHIGEGTARPFDITGKPMKGWVMVDKRDLRSLRDYERWAAKGLAFAESLPPK